jgi:hypothetical protein
MRWRPDLEKQFACAGDEAERSPNVARRLPAGRKAAAELNDAVKVCGQSGLSASNSGGRGGPARFRRPPQH